MIPHRKWSSRTQITGPLCHVYYRNKKYLNTSPLHYLIKWSTFGKHENSSLLKNFTSTSTFISNKILNKDISQVTTPLGEFFAYKYKIFHLIVPSFLDLSLNLHLSWIHRFLAVFPHHDRDDLISYNRVLTTRRDIFKSCSSGVYFEITPKPLQSDNYSGHISLFLGVKMKDKFHS